MDNFIDITGQQFGEWTALEYDKNTKLWTCKCSCGTIRQIPGCNLRKKYTQSCGHLRYTKYNLRPELIGTVIENWKILVSNKLTYTCECIHCGQQKRIDKDAVHNETNLPTCKCSKENFKQDLVGQHIKDWTVLEYIGNNLYTCQCICGTLRDYTRSALTQKSLAVNCGCTVEGAKAHSKYSKRKRHAMQDLIGMRFGKLKVIEYAGKGKWTCKCDCGNITEVWTTHLTSGASKTCGRHTKTDLTNVKVKEWTVIKYAQDSNWLCRCSCGTYKLYSTYSLTSKQCAEHCGSKVHKTHHR